MLIRTHKLQPPPPPKSWTTEHCPQKVNILLRNEDVIAFLWQLWKWWNHQVINPQQEVCCFFEPKLVLFLKLRVILKPNDLLILLSAEENLLKWLSKIWMSRKFFNGQFWLDVNSARKAPWWGFFNLSCELKLKFENGAILKNVANSLPFLLLVRLDTEEPLSNWMTMLLNISWVSNQAWPVFWTLSSLNKDYYA